MGDEPLQPRGDDDQCERQRKQREEMQQRDGRTADREERRVPDIEIRPPIREAGPCACAGIVRGTHSVRSWKEIEVRGGVTRNR